MSDTPSSETAAPIEDVAPAESVAAAPEAGAPVPAVSGPYDNIVVTGNITTVLGAFVQPTAVPPFLAAPVRPENGSLHDILAWLEAKVAWLDSKF